MQTGNKGRISDGCRGWPFRPSAPGLGLAATIQLACCTPGLAWMEMMYEPPTRTIDIYQRLGGIIKNKIWIDAEGYVAPPDGPGLGITIDEEMIPRYAV